MKLRNLFLMATFLLAVGASFAFKTKGTGVSAFFIYSGTTYCNIGVTEQNVCDMELTGPVCTVKRGDYHYDAYDNGPFIPCTVLLRQP